MSVFRTIVFSAALSGLIVGATATVIQHAGTGALIAKAEVYEKGAEAAPAATALPVPHRHDAGAAPHGHHAAAAWEPQDGLERSAYTALFNVVDWFGFSLLVGGALVLFGRPASWREGLLWGLAGFVVFVIAPTLGLAPELPGVPAAPLGPRQIWWVAAAASAALGLGLIAFTRSLPAAILAVAVMGLPHLVGAPHLDQVETNVPAELSRRFTEAVLVGAFVCWALVGGLTGFFCRRFAAREDAFPDASRQGVG